MLSHKPRIKFTYGNRKSRTQAQTLQPEEESESSSDDEELKKLLEGTSKKNNNNKHQAKKPRLITHGRDTTTTTRRISDRLLKSNDQQESSSTHNRECTPLDQDLLLILQVQKPQTSSSSSSRTPNSAKLTSPQHKNPRPQPAQRSSPRRVNNKRKRTQSKVAQEDKEKDSLSQRRITRTSSQKSLKPPELPQSISQPNPTSPDHPRDELHSPPNLSHKSQPPRISDSPDHSDIFAILETTETSNDLEESMLFPKKTRAASSEPSQSISQPDPASPDHHRDELHFSPSLPNVSHKSPTPYRSDTRDHSDIFAILETTKTSNDLEESILFPKKARVASMGSKSNSKSGILSPPLSPGNSRPTSPINRSLKNRVLSSTNSCSELFPTRNSSNQLKPRKPLARQLSSDFPPIPVNHESINTSNLVNGLFPSSSSSSHHKPITKTYGGERTYKQDDNELNLLMPIPTPQRTSPRKSSAANKTIVAPLKRFQSRETYTELRKKWGVDEDDDDRSIEDQSELQTINHQRASGTSQKFTDELSYLIQGLISSSSVDTNIPDLLSLQRSSAIEVIKKLKQDKFIEELRTNGSIEDVYNSFRLARAGQGDDLILDHSLLIFISILTCYDQKFIEPVLRIPLKSSDPRQHQPSGFSLKSDCLQVLGSLAARSYPTTQNPRGSSRRHPSLGSQIQEVVQESVLSKHFEGPTTPALLALFSLARIAMFIPRPGLLPQRSIVHSTAFAAVINGLKVHTIRLNELFDTSIKDFTSQEEGYKILKHVGYCMDVIEACTVSEEEALSYINLYKLSLAKNVFGSLITLCHTLARHHHLTHISMSALDILIGCLRSMVNMTNYNSAWSDELSSPSVIESICGLFGICREGFNNQHQRGSIATPPKKCSPKRKIEDGLMTADLGRRSAPDNRVDHVVFDLLCVCLGLLTNLLEQSGLATNILRETRIVILDGAHSTLVPVNSLNSVGGFQELLKLYIDPPCRKLDEKKFIRGSICVLINLILLNGYEDTNGDDDDRHQSINEIEIIKSFKNILDQIPILLHPDDHQQEQEQEHTNLGSSRAKEDVEVIVDGEPKEEEEGKLVTKNEIIKSFLTDLKLHSGTSNSTSISSSSSSQQPQQQSSVPTGNHSSQSLPVHHSVNLLSILNSCWNRLRVELI
ncbi:hypothetical protein MJO28_008345 [Puccinia striiformis f. sp. tritici]|uniref:Uncharacterized protein n=1 Tax=Puccinia striiformis f. sp. tritici TaxID=168172 RepID=A0ACC0EAM5_9BASI|nr:hypothetical protein MJO28_008345 [Puccinia striiformis f. sp. tritici]